MRFASRGQQRYDKFPEDCRWMLRVPRYSRLLSQLPTERFERLNSLGAVYWECYTYVAANQGPEIATGILDDCFRGEEACWFGCKDETSRSPKEMQEQSMRHRQCRLALDMIAAIAFEMMWDSTPATGAKPSRRKKSATINSDAVKDSKEPTVRWYIDKNVATFQENVRRRMEDAGAFYLDKPGEAMAWGLDWKRLTAMNSTRMQYLTFNDTDKRVQFRDITIRNFFAAVWALRWSNATDRKRLMRALPDPLLDPKFEYQEFWNFVIELAELSEACDCEEQVNLIWPDVDCRGEAMFDPLYNPAIGFVDSDGGVIRSTELIYRTWNFMEGTESRTSFEAEFSRILVDEFDREKQTTARRFFNVGDASLVASHRGSNFLLLSIGQRFRDDRCEFFPKSAEIYTCVDILDTYRLSRFCVTNSEYELFDKRHFVKREFTTKTNNLDRHPVVNVSWFDAWCFARWIGNLIADNTKHHVCLPSELMWEYACRAGRTTQFSWSDDLTIDAISGQCNCDGRIGRTVAVDGTDERFHNFLPNPWGFYHMHGNVDEWCDDWYQKKRLERLVRGGNWRVTKSCCSSSSRDGRRDYERKFDTGFRLAAIPIGSVK